MSDADARRPGVVRSEEELVVRRDVRPVGDVRVRKEVESHDVARDFERRVGSAEIERVDAQDGDSGEVETLPAGSLSIPVLEEQLVVTKRVVVRERIIVRRLAEVRTERVEATLRRERVEVEADDGVDLERDGDGEA